MVASLARRNIISTRHGFSDGSPSSRDNFFFPPPCRSEKASQFPQCQDSHVETGGQDRGVCLFLTSAHLTTQEGARQNTARLLNIVIKILKPTPEALCCRRGRAEQRMVAIYAGATQHNLHASGFCLTDRLRHKTTSSFHPPCRSEIASQFPQYQYSYGKTGGPDRGVCLC